MGVHVTGENIDVEWDDNEQRRNGGAEGDFEGATSTPQRMNNGAKTYKGVKDRGMYFPLRIKGDGKRHYVPWSHRDAQTLADQLPSLSKGASPWIAEFE